MLTQWFFGHRMHVGCMFYLADPHLQSKFCERGVELGSGLASLLFFWGVILSHTHTHREIYLYTCSDFRLPTANVCKYDVVLPGSSQVQQLSGTARVLAPGVYLFSKRAENILIQKDPGEIRLRWLELKGMLGCSGEKNISIWCTKDFEGRNDSSYVSVALC